MPCTGWALGPSPAGPLKKFAGRFGPGPGPGPGPSVSGPGRAWAVPGPNKNINTKYFNINKNLL